MFNWTTGPLHQSAQQRQNQAISIETIWPPPEGKNTLWFLMKSLPTPESCQRWRLRSNLWLRIPLGGTHTPLLFLSVPVVAPVEGKSGFGTGTVGSQSTLARWKAALRPEVGLLMPSEPAGSAERASFSFWKTTAYGSVDPILCAKLFLWVKSKSLEQRIFSYKYIFNFKGNTWICLLKIFEQLR